MQIDLTDFRRLTRAGYTQYKRKKPGQPAELTGPRSHCSLPP